MSTWLDGLLHVPTPLLWVDANLCAQRANQAWSDGSVSMGAIPSFTPGQALNGLLPPEFSSWVAGLRVSPPDQAIPTTANKQVRLFAARAEDGFCINLIPHPRAQLDLEQIASKGAHDMGGSLRAIHGFSDLLKLEGDLSEDAKEYLHYIERGAGDLSRAINGLVRYLRLDHRTVTIAAIDLPYMFDRLAYSQRKILKTDQEEVPETKRPSLIFPEDDPNSDPIKSDVELLFTALDALIQNALLYGGEAPTVRIAIEQQDAQATFWVIDSGEGISESDQSRAMGLFQRLVGPDDFPGPGIGLTCAQKIAERLGGRILFSRRQDAFAVGCQIAITS